jgi:hypothetical protein
MTDLYQGDLFDKSPDKPADNPAAPILGLPVQMPRECRHCGSFDAVIGAGSGPHLASLICRACE